MLVLDTAVGIEPGEVIVVGLEDLAVRGSVSPRSSHRLPIAQALARARAVRGVLPPGRFVGIGGRWFGFGSLRSRDLRSGMPAYERAVESAIKHLLAARPVQP